MGTIRFSGIFFEEVVEEFSLYSLFKNGKYTMPSSSSYRTPKRSRKRARSVSRSGGRSSSTMVGTGIKGTYPIYKWRSYINRRVFPITQTAVQNMALIPSQGLNGVTGYDITLGVCQSNAIYQQSNGAWNNFGSAYQNYANLAGTFQEYRILRMEVDIMYSSNSIAPATAIGTAITNALPIVYAVTDREDDRNISSTYVALQYSSCRTYQMGVGDQKNRISLANPSCFNVMLNSSSLFGSAVQGAAMRSPWLPCGTNSAGGSANSIPHGFIKIYIDPVNTSQTATGGDFTFIVRAIMEYRGID